MMGAGGCPMRFLTIPILLFVGAAHAQPGAWTENEARAFCANDLRRQYGDALTVVSFMGKQPHENNTTLVGLVAIDNRIEHKGQQVTVGCIYYPDGSVFTIFFNSKIANWIAPKKRLPAWAGGAYAPSTKRATAPEKRPSPSTSNTERTYTPARRGKSQEIAACTSRGIAYFQAIGSYPTLKTAPNTGRSADEVARERCNRTTTAF